MLLSVKSVIVLEIGGGDVEVQQDTDLIWSEVGPVVQRVILLQLFTDILHSRWIWYTSKK